MHPLAAPARRDGAGTEVLVTGGDPTLRDEEERVRIVARISGLGMHANLLTNGIKATRPLLARAGLRDVAFHVDTTQQRSGLETEASLASVRDRYIERARPWHPHRVQHHRA